MKAKYYVVTEAGNVYGTNDLEKAEAYNDGDDIVFDAETGKHLGGEEIEEAPEVEEEEEDGDSEED